MDELVGTVAELWRYPVKSMGGERLDAAAAGERGLAGDRVWAVADAETGLVASAKRPTRWGPLLECAADYVAEPEPVGAPAPVHISLPDGSEVRSDDPDRDRVLSAALGRRVTMLSSAPEGAAYEVEDGDAVRESRVGSLAPAGTFFDASTLHVLGSATLARMAAAHPAGRWDPRRFRPNVLVDVADGGSEDVWIGHAVGIGPDVRIAVHAPMPRCVMTTVPQGDLPHDPAILRTLGRENRRDVPGSRTSACAGLLASITAGGTVRAGDAVVLGGSL
jgi:uncharacterized protein YcbX